jgi:hypothetical protein
MRISSHDLRLKDEVAPDQRAYIDKISQRLQLCRDPGGGYALFVRIRSNQI